MAALWETYLTFLTKVYLGDFLLIPLKITKPVLVAQKKPTLVCCFPSWKYSINASEAST